MFAQFLEGLRRSVRRPLFPATGFLGVINV